MQRDSIQKIGYSESARDNNGIMENLQKFLERYTVLSVLHIRSFSC